jgi:hypothetical protein
MHITLTSVEVDEDYLSQTVDLLESCIKVNTKAAMIVCRCISPALNTAKLEEGFLESVESKLEEGFLESVESKLGEGFLESVESKLEEGFLESVESKLEEGFLESVESKLEEGFLESVESKLEEGFFESEPLRKASSKTYVYAYYRASTTMSICSEDS